MGIKKILFDIVIYSGLFMVLFWQLSALKNFILNKNKRSIKISSRLKDKELKSITILIPCYNEEKTIRKTVLSVLNSDYPKNKIHIIAINDHSKDNTLKILKELKQKYNNITILNNKKNLGKAKSLNKALKYVKTEYFATLDADSIVGKEALRSSITYMILSTYNIGAVISKIKVMNNKKNILTRLQDLEYIIASFIRYLMGFLGTLHVTPGVLSIYKTDIIKKIGGFDEENITEDFEIAVRLKKYGYYIYLNMNSINYTNVPETIKSFIKQRIRWTRGFIQTHCKHKDIFFNKKYGIFGLFQYPFNVFSYIVLNISFGLIIYNIYRSIYFFIYRLINAPSTIKFFTLDFHNFILTINTKIGFLLFIAFILNLFLFIYILRSFEKKDWNDYFYYIAFFVIFIIFYQYHLIYVWSTSLFKEITRKERKW